MKPPKTSPPNAAEVLSAKAAKASAIAAVAAVIVAIVSGFISYQQLKASRTQVRAWVTLKDIEGVGDDGRLKIIIRNSGQGLRST
jgi:hypothetical protein